MKKNHKTKTRIYQRQLDIIGGYAVTVKSLYMLALPKKSLDGEFVLENSCKPYLLHSHARNSLSALDQCVVMALYKYRILLLLFIIYL